MNRGLYNELVTHVEKILHGAADVRFDQPYDEIKISNVVFSHKIYDLFDEIKNHRKKNGSVGCHLILYFHRVRVWHL